VVYNQLNASLDSNWTIERPPLDPSALVGDIASKAQLNPSTLETFTSGIRSALEETSNTTKSDPHDPSLNLAKSLGEIKPTLAPGESRFYGNSSGAVLVRTAMELRNEYTGGLSGFDSSVKPAVKLKRPYFWNPKPVRAAFLYSFLCLHSVSGTAIPEQLRH